MKESKSNEISPGRKIFVLVNGKPELLDREKFLKDFGVDGVVRIPEDEFGDIDMQSGEFGHFNLGSTTHEVGKKYLILKIKQSGVSAKGESTEQLPLLSTEGAVVAVCIKAENNLPYNSLTPEHFEHSMRGVGDRESLADRIYKRYKGVRLGLTQEEAMKQGVGFTLFQILGPAEVK